MRSGAPLVDQIKSQLLEAGSFRSQCARICTRRLSLSHLKECQVWEAGGQNEISKIVC